MSEKMWKEAKEGFAEGFTDMLHLYVDLFTAPFIAIYRVLSDFVHGEGRYKHSDHGSGRTP